MFRKRWAFILLCFILTVFFAFFFPFLVRKGLNREDEVEVAVMVQSLKDVSIGNLPDDFLVDPSDTFTYKYQVGNSKTQ